jgi:hypothetical protein
MDHDNDFLVILDDEDAMARQFPDLDADASTPPAPRYQDSSLAICGIRTRPRVMAWEQGRLVMRTPTRAVRPHGRSPRTRR